MSTTFNITGANIPQYSQKAVYQEPGTTLRRSTSGEQELIEQITHKGVTEMQDPYADLGQTCR